MIIDTPLNSFVSKRTTCRLCDGANLILVMPIKASPIADAFVDDKEKYKAQPLIPLDLYQCQTCGHVQNLDIVKSDLLFRDYLFNTASSAGLVEHFRHYANDVINSMKLPSHSLVVEIGSNDGTLLRFFKNKQMRVQGIDPALDIASNACESGIPTIPDFFTAKLAVKIRHNQGAAKLVVANNVYAHADDLADITDGIASILDQDGVFIFEVSYLMDMIDEYLFDTVYHEHLSYHSITPLQRFFPTHGLHLFDVQRSTSKGGSIRCFVQKAGGKRKEQAIIQDMIKVETRRGLSHPEIFYHYTERVLARKAAMLEFIDRLKKTNQSIVGYGASTTVTTLIYHFELFDKLDHLIDDNPKKHGLYSPGCHLEVKPSQVLYDNSPDVVIILAWQYAKAIISKHPRYIAQGGKFVIPLPEIKVIQ